MKREIAIELPPLVPFIDGTVPNWEERARHCLEDGFNFFILLPDGSQPQLAEVLALRLEALPQPKSKAELLSSSRFVEQKDFRLPESSAERIYHVEQLWLPRTRPPLVKQYVLYCYIRGIISQHDLPSDARVACDHYNNDRFARQQFPEAAIYRWEHTEWRRTRLC
jgi:hypothetical protein